MSSTWTVELHTHTLYSKDCLTSLADLLTACRRKGLDKVAVTDHNRVEGALRLREMALELVIVGEEVKTRQGEILAYFIEERVPGGLPVEEAIARVRAQGGVVGVSHPLDRLRREAMGRRNLLPILDRIDLLEVFNARSILNGDNEAARVLAEERGLLQIAGSDAHTIWELGRATVELAPFDSPAGFLESLRTARLGGRLSPPWIHWASVYARLVRGLGLAPPPPRS